MVPLSTPRSIGDPSGSEMADGSPQLERNGSEMGPLACPLQKSAKTTRPGVIRTHDQGIMSPLL